jgi:hypothetical protein
MFYEPEDDIEVVPLWGSAKFEQLPGSIRLVAVHLAADGNRDLEGFKPIWLSKTGNICLFQGLHNENSPPVFKVSTLFGDL